MTAKPVTILVVDDTPGARYALTKILQRAQYVVKEAGSGRETLRLAAEKPDLIILDIGLPDMSGYEVCQKIKADPATASIPVLHLSASFVESENRVRGLEGGADGYLTYPLEPPELLANVQALLRVREAERLVREQRELLQVTLNSIGDAVIATDGQGRVTFLNPVAQSLTGWGPEEAAGRPLGEVFRIVSEETGRPAEDPVAKVIRQGAAVGLANHTLLIARDGTKRPIDDTAAPIRTQEGGFLGVVLVFRDVTGRRAAEEALRASELRHRRLFNGDLIGILAALPDGRITEANDAFLRMVGYDRDDLAAGRLNWQAMTPPEALAAELETAARMARETGQARYEKEFIRKDGSRVPVVLGGAFVEGAGGEAVCFVLDITERKRAEDALREAARRKDEFLAMLSHELRNPLAPIRNAGHILRLAGDQNPAVGQAGEMVERQVQHMTRLVDDLLDVSRVSRGKIQLREEKVDLATVIARAIESVQPLIDARGHELILTLPTRPVRLGGDVTRLVQIVANLLNNAAKYTDPGGRIWLTAGRDGGAVEVRVKDTGIGIAPEALPHVFDLFTQADRALDRSQGGLGIGLTLVKSLVDMHGGSVRAHSEGPGRGSEFVVRLPALPEERAEGRAGGEEPTTRRITPSSRRRVLIVDDNVDSAASLAMLLQLQRHEVNVAHDGREAVEAVRRHQPEIVFLDIGLPGMSGLEVARALRQEHGREKLVLVAMTGYGHEEDRRQSQEAGFDAHMVKPVDLSALESFLAHPTQKGFEA
jgi:PAS domain S-box-containing protein